MFSRKNSFRLFIAALMLLMLPACEALISQDPADSFWNKKFPRQLEWIRSQLREITQKDKDMIVDRVQKDANRTDLLRVGVIDSGVDIAHEDLLNQIAYRVQDGRVVGAGADIMGNAASGSHVLVDPTIFAFGAKEIREGRIVEPVESPLALLKQVNDRLAELLVDGIQKDPDLRQSLFANLTRENISFIDFDDLKQDPESFKESYEKNKKENRLIKRSPPSDKSDKENELKWKLYKDVTGPWVLDIADQELKQIKYFKYIEHGDKFKDLVIASFDTIEKEFQYEKSIQNVMEFMSKAKNKNIDRNDALEEIKKSLAFVIWNVDSFDPIIRLEAALAKIPKYANKNFEEALQMLAVRKVQEIEAALKANPHGRKEELDALKKALKNAKSLGSIGKALNDLKKDPAAYQTLRSNLRRYVYRTQHPYIAGESNSNSHGTHVSGVIAKQDPRVRIFPIRVTTQTVTISEDRKKEVVHQFLNDFQTWSQNPLVDELKKTLSAEYSGLKVSDSATLKHVKEYLNKNVLNAIFISDVLRAVETAGKEQIKIANVSLGTTFKKDYRTDRKDKVKSYVVDLFSEYARYKIGQTIQEKAPGTLFVVATGNDGGWADGISKTAFPVGITSTRLMKIAQEKNLPEAPNNTAKNILAVSSVNPNGTMTEFTNLMIDPKIPQVFSTGEEIMSPVPNKEATRARRIISDVLNDLFMSTNTIESVENIDTREKMKRIEDPNEMLKLKEMIFLGEMQTSLLPLLHASNPPTRVRMSGTSMATPTVTGILAEYILKRMAEEKISSKDLYKSTTLSPENIIKGAMAMTKTSPYSTGVTIKMLIEGIETWDRSANEKAMDRKARQLFKPQTVVTPQTCERAVGL